jgi:hypothetical protein
MMRYVRFTAMRRALVCLLIVMLCAGCTPGEIRQTAETPDPSPEPSAAPTMARTPDSGDLQQPQRPNLSVSYLVADSTGERVAASCTAKKGGSSWDYAVSNWQTRRIIRDGTGPLMYPSFSGAELETQSVDAVLQLTFDYPPETITVQRWEAKYHNDQSALISRAETIAVTENRISVLADGHAYIYEVYATWPQGYVQFGFRTYPGQSD